ncbi:MAG: NAD+ synthase [Bacteroidales bacterium]|nr:NAD+ synthase [Bacteroidales bacterium]
MKISIAQLNYLIGDFTKNVELINDAIDKAKKEGADLVLFSELSVCGCPPFDLLKRDYFIQKCENAVDAIAKKCDGITAVIGAPTRNNTSGKKPFNSALAVSDDKIVFSTSKSAINPLGSHNEQKYFESNNHLVLFEFKGKRIAITINEDLLQDKSSTNSFNKLLIKKIIKLNPDLIVTIAAIPFSHTEIESRTQLFCDVAKKCGVPVIMVNQTGANTDLIYEGGSMIINKDGRVVKRLPFFEEAIFTFDLEKCLKETKTVEPQYNHIALMHDAIVLGIRDYFKKTGLKSAVLGLSGGIDSAIVLCLAVEAIGNKNVRAVLMPSRYSSDHSIKDSVDLANNLNIQYDIVSIEKQFSAFEDILAPLFTGREEDVTEENIQARSRAVILMAISNKFGNMLLNTSNKSEAAVGYGTLYGDMAGGLSVIGDVYKTDVYRLSRYVNREKEIIPENILTKKPSAELHPDQFDSDSLPDYAILDSILFQYLEQEKSADQITGENIDKATVDRVIKMVNRNEHKRHQFAPILRVSSKPFGKDRLLPLVGRL